MVAEKVVNSVVLMAVQKELTVWMLVVWKVVVLVVVLVLVRVVPSVVRMVAW